MLIPSGGYGYSDRPGHAFHDPAADAALVEALERDLTSGVELLKIEAQINDPAVAAAVANKMGEMMQPDLLPMVQALALQERPLVLAKDRVAESHPREQGTLEPGRADGRFQLGQELVLI